MTIQCYSGLPGSGKTYSALENVVIPALKARRYVTHNLKLKRAELQVVCDPQDGKPFSVDDYLVDLDFPPNIDDPSELADLVVAQCRPGSVIVLDEVWQYWPGGKKASEFPSSQLDFFKRHRHRVDEATGHATEITIIDQDPRTGLPAFLRSLVELTFIHTKLNHVGASKRFRVEVYSGCQPIDRPSKAAHIRKMMGSYKPEVWNCYISHTESKSTTPGLELVPDDRGNVWKSWTAKAAIAAALLMPIVGYFVWSSVDTMAKPTKSKPAIKKPLSTPTDTTSVASTPSLPVQTEPPIKTPSTVWRVVGTIFTSYSTLVILQSATGTRLVRFDRCNVDDSGQPECEIDGHFITTWSGAPEATVLGQTVATPESVAARIP